MHRLGSVRRSPRQRVAERDEQAVTTRKEATWEEVKRPGRPAGAERGGGQSVSGSARRWTAPGVPVPNGPCIALRRCMVVFAQPTHDTSGASISSMTTRGRASLRPEPGRRSPKRSRSGRLRVACTRTPRPVP
ncbi:hypothetical protein ABT314_18385 [Streptomyces spiralis]|uniref:hypothetical protein n=1 Tax=Streptomyces spiralis TaxID=66376 RepID=UPI001E4C11C5|nr:hypothetical protein [Streptomyces spiralis]